MTHRHELHFFEPHLSGETVSLASGFDAVCIFVNDQVERRRNRKALRVGHAADRVALRRL